MGATASARSRSIVLGAKRNMSFATRAREEVSMFGQLGALVTIRCEWCGRELRPCNLKRHTDAAHFRQLTIDEMLR
jgi:hypothetical protein